MLWVLWQGLGDLFPQLCITGGFSARSLMAEASPSNTAMTLIRLVT